MLHLLRGATLATLFALALSLWWVFTASGRRLPAPQRSAWLIVACVYSALTVDFALAEVLLWLRQGPWAGTPSLGGWRRIYNSGFLLNAVADAVMPAGLLALLLHEGRSRFLSVFAIALICCVGIVGISEGALRDWSTLLTTTQVISFLGIGGYLVFCAFVVLGRLSGAGRHLAGVVAVSAIFTIVLPVQEVIFQSVGREASNEIWHLNQFLQLARMVAQLAIVLALINSLARGERPVSSVPAAGQSAGG